MSRRPAQDATSATGRVYSGPVASVTKLLNRQDQSLCMHAEKRAKLDEETTALATCKRTDLLMAANYPKRAAKGSQHVFALDELSFDEVTPIAVHVRNSDPGPMNIYVPRDYAQYQCDVYDARDHVELSLAMKQACIIDLSDATGAKYFSPSNRVQTNKFFQKVPQDKCKVLRKNVFVVDANETHRHPKLADDLKVACTVTFVDTMTEAFEEIFNLETKPSVRYQASEMSPPMITYAGIAMTDAYYNASNGDPFVTSNLYSLITMLNGPHDAVHGDPMHWIWRIEQHYYDPKTGLRHKRPLWYNVDQNKLKTESPDEKNDVNWRDDARMARIGHQFQMVPLKLGFEVPDYASRFGVLDGMNQRKVGIAQSNALKFQSMDITNCGKCIN